MNYRKASLSIEATGCFTILIIYVVLFIPISLWTQSNIEYWLSQLKERPVHCPWIGAAACTVLPPIVAIDVVASVARLATDVDYRIPQGATQ